MNIEIFKAFLIVGSAFVLGVIVGTEMMNAQPCPDCGTPSTKPGRK